MKNFLKKILLRGFIATQIFVPVIAGLAISQIIAPHTALAALTDNLVSYWKLDESSGNAADSVGSNTLINAGVVYAAGKINNAGDFELGDTTDALTILDITQSGLDITGSFTFCAWLKPESAPATDSNMSILSKFNTGQRAYRFDYLNQSGTLKIVVSLSSDGTTANNYGVNYDLGTGTFHDVCATWNSSTKVVTIYVDGTSQGTASSTEGSLFNGTATFDIGNTLTSVLPFDGLIDEVGVWSRDISAAEVTSLYAGGAGNQYPFTAAAIPPPFLFLFE